MNYYRISTFQFHCGSIGCITTVNVLSSSTLISIPLWFNWLVSGDSFAVTPSPNFNSTVVQLVELMFLQKALHYPNFNSTVVQLVDARTLQLSSKLSFQFHCGSIGWSKTDSQLLRTFISIPLWFNWLSVSVLIVNITSSISIPLWFNWLYINKIYVYGWVKDFNSTVVQLVVSVNGDAGASGLTFQFHCGSIG